MRTPCHTLSSVVALALLSSAPFHSAQANKYWACGDGQWDANCWSATFGGALDGSGQPLGGNVYLYNNTTTNYQVNYWNTAYPSTTLNYLKIDATGSGTMTLSQTQDNLQTHYESIGYTGTGAVVQTGGTHSITNGIDLGSTTTGDGTLSVSNTASLSAGNLGVGSYGTGTLNITNGGSVSVTGSNSLGYFSGSNGTTIVDGEGSNLTNGFFFRVGESGSGTLNITNGGSVSGVYDSIGYYSGSTGTATVDGAGSNWTSSGYFAVGIYGNGTLNITNGGSVSSNNASVNLGSQPGSTGAVTVDGTGSNWIISSDLYVGGGSFAAGGDGTVNVQNNGTLTAGAIRVWNTSTVNLNNGVINAALVDNLGQLNGTGVINASVTNAGVMAPGQSPGLLEINGDFTQTIDGTLAIELGGLLTGTEYDELDISGTATLGGTLDLRWFDLGSGLFNASLGDSFDILTAESLVGEFDLLTLALLGDGLNWQLDYLFDEIGTTDIVRLTVVSAVPVPAAVWLFSSGLIALFGMARRRN